MRRRKASISASCARCGRLVSKRANRSLAACLSPLLCAGVVPPDSARGQPEAGTNAAPVNVSERVLRDRLFVPYEAAVKEANARAATASYHEIVGVPYTGISVGWG